MHSQTIQRLHKFANVWTVVLYSLAISEDAFQRVRALEYISIHERAEDQMLPYTTPLASLPLAS